MHAVLEITLDEDLDLGDFSENLCRMFGQETFDAVSGSVTGEVRFHGLVETNLALDGLDRHQKLIESYKKLHQARR
jgi:ribosomal protein S12 methylthiotransferase accessory factor